MVRSCEGQINNNYVHREIRVHAPGGGPSGSEGQVVSQVKEVGGFSPAFLVEVSLKPQQFRRFHFWGYLSPDIPQHGMGREVGIDLTGLLRGSVVLPQDDISVGVSTHTDRHRVARCVHHGQRACGIEANPTYRGGVNEGAGDDLLGRAGSTLINLWSQHNSTSLAARFVHMAGGIRKIITLNNNAPNHVPPTIPT